LLNGPAKPYKYPAPNTKNIKPGIGKHPHTNIALDKEMNVICDPCLLDHLTKFFNITDIRGIIKMNIIIIVIIIANFIIFCFIFDMDDK
jgi:hypothetical protein